MNVLPHLTSLNFALAGLLCACGPVIIHLLNRRRFREVQWAAMDFLLEAFRRERRILRIRDWIVLALRTLAVLFFGLARSSPLLFDQRADPRCRVASSRDRIDRQQFEHGLSHDGWHAISAGQTRGATID